MRASGTDRIFPEIPEIEAHLCCFNEKVDIVVDGVPQERPTSPWS